MIDRAAAGILRPRFPESARLRCAQLELPWARGLVAALLLGLSIGCSGEVGPECQPVRGLVTLDGKALAEATVVYHRLDPPASSDLKPLAYTDSNGHYALTTVRGSDGALPGKYVITVELRAPRMVGEELVRDGRNLLPARYSRPETSGLQYEVVAGENEVPPLALRSR